MQKIRQSRKALIENFAELTKNDGGVDALRVKLKVGNSTIQRLRAGETVQLDTLETVADHYRVEVHRLLLPKLGSLSMPFSDLNAFESQLVTLFRRLNADQQHDVLIDMNKLADRVGDSPSEVSPFRRTGGRAPKPQDERDVFRGGDSGLSPLDAIPPTKSRGAKK